MSIGLTITVIDGGWPGEREATTKTERGRYWLLTSSSWEEKSTEQESPSNHNSYSYISQGMRKTKGSDFTTPTQALLWPWDVVVMFCTWTFGERCDVPFSVYINKKMSFVPFEFDAYAAYPQILCKSALGEECTPPYGRFFSDCNTKPPPPPQQKNDARKKWFS